MAVHNVTMSETVGVSTMTANLSLRSNLSVPNMMAACRFSRAVKTVEDANQGSAFGEFWDELFHNATACVMLSVASIEAYINELFFDSQTLFPNHAEEVLRVIWDSYERKPVIDKFDLALLLKGANPIDKSREPYQSIPTLIALRNALVHFKPEWDTAAEQHKKMSDKLAPKVTPSAFLNDSLIFPRRWAGHSCTSWAVTSAVSFVREFEDNLGRTHIYPDMATLNP